MIVRDFQRRHYFNLWIIFMVCYEMRCWTPPFMGLKHTVICSMCTVTHPSNADGGSHEPHATLCTTGLYTCLVEVRWLTPPPNPSLREGPDFWSHILQAAWLSRVTRLHHPGFAAHPTTTILQKFSICHKHFQVNHLADMLFHAASEKTPMILETQGVPSAPVIPRLLLVAP